MAMLKDTKTSTEIYIKKERGQEASRDIDGKNRLRGMLRKEELSGWKWWKRRQ